MSRFFGHPLFYVHWVYMIHNKSHTAQASITICHIHDSNVCWCVCATVFEILLFIFRIYLFASASENEWLFVIIINMLRPQYVRQFCTNIACRHAFVQNISLTRRGQRRVENERSSTSIELKARAAQTRASDTKNGCIEKKMIQATSSSAWNLCGNSTSGAHPIFFVQLCSRTKQIVRLHIIIIELARSITLKYHLSNWSPLIDRCYYRWKSFEI